MQQGGSQYGVPPTDMTQFNPTGTGGRAQMLGISGPDQLQQQQHQLAEAASPISSRPPPPQPVVRPPNFDELVPAGVPGGFTDDDALAAASGEEAERGGVPGNRWPRQETLALLKIRSEMDAAFRDATFKGPLWEDVSRKLAELGYTRSAKKCKEKFENVHKYYKRTKEGRAGRQDGKNYRFFSQLEALHSSSSASATPNTTTSSLAMTSSPPATAPFGVGTSSLAGSSTRLQPSPISAAPPLPFNTTALVATDLTAAGTSAGISSSAAAAGISFSSNTSSSSSSESDDEATEEGAGAREGRKRKHSGSSGGSRKMMAFFEGLMKQVMERQEAMQQRFLDTIEKREQDRMIREEAWRRQEMARLSHEHELMSQERAMAASRDAAVITFLQKVSGQNIQLPPLPGAPPPQAPPAPPIPSQQHQQPPQPQQSQQYHHHTEVARHQASSSSDLVPVPESQETVGSGGFEPVTSSSRWPKSEVHALIDLRSALEARYQESGPKGPLWEEISAEMHKLGHNRSAKRCKEKWENINKYFKKVKESNKRRPEDAKTCPYFHQLEALYRKKLHSGGGGGGSSGGSGSMLGSQRQKEQETNPNPQERSDVLQIMAPPAAPASQQLQPEGDVKSGNNNRHDGNTEGGNGSTSIQIPTSNGGLPPSFFEEGNTSDSTMKKPEDIMKELMEQQQQQQHRAVMDDYDKLEEPDSDNMDRECDDEDDEDDEESKMQYKIQFQRQNVGNGGGSAANAPAKGAATPAGSFLAMVQ